MTTKKKKAGRPGPAFTIGIPMVLAAFAGSWGYSYFNDSKQPANPTLAREAHLTEPVTFKVAADPWSGYSTFRSEPKFTAELAKDKITIEYIDDEKYYDQNERMKALAAGELDIALTTLDAFLQHGAAHVDGGKFPGEIIFGIDESAGGDAIFLGKGKKSFDEVTPEDKVCYSVGTPSEHLWDFASLAFAGLGDNLGKDNGVVAKDCWEKLTKNEVQVAVLWQPYTALAVKAGYAKVFATGGQADDVILDIAVANHSVLEDKRPALQQLVAAYFRTIDALQKDAKHHGDFVTKDCGPDCEGDAALGAAVLEGIDFLTLEENLCLWFGQCDQPNKIVPRVGKTGRLLVAKGKLAANALPQPESIIDDGFLVAIKEERISAAQLAREVAGPEAQKMGPVFAAQEAKYSYTVPGAEGVGVVGTLQLPQVYFREGSYGLTEDAKLTIASIGEQLRSFPALCVRIAGHTNSNGDPKANRQLSKFRALAIAAELTRLDADEFPASRFDVKGYGSDQPILVGGVEDSQASRRTEFTLVNCAGNG